MSEQHSTSEGRWISTATATNLPAGKIEWHCTPRRACVAMVDGRQVATIRRNAAHGIWSARMTGWVWTVTPDMGTARFRVKETEPKAFATSREAKKAIERAWAVSPSA